MEEWIVNESSGGKAVHRTMGQYQQPSIPFAISSLGYGFLWNHPGVGTAKLDEEE